ncbi:MAG: hypothetical protein ABJJ53_11270 [Sulfitobacter sp.]
MDKETKAQPILELPYSDRQLILVSDDQLVQATEKQARLALHEKQQGFDWKKIVEAALIDIIPLPFSRTLEATARETIRSWGRAREEGASVLPVGKTAAQQIDFPPGHPRDGVLYVGHPAKPSLYFTMADFHRVVFEHKFCEAIELLMSLGATSIRVEHISGWSKEFSARISVPLADADDASTGEAGAKRGVSQSLLYEANLAGVEPSLPDDLVWYHHEPTWQSIAKGRLKYGLNDFSLSVSYQDDFGINAGLKIALAKTGLDVGGKFEDHQSTVWRLEGKFRGATSA